MGHYTCSMQIVLIGKPMWKTDSQSNKYQLQKFAGAVDSSATYYGTDKGCGI